MPLRHGPSLFHITPPISSSEEGDGSVMCRRRLGQQEAAPALYGCVEDKWRESSLASIRARRAYGEWGQFQLLSVCDEDERGATPTTS